MIEDQRDELNVYGFQFLFAVKGLILRCTDGFLSYGIKSNDYLYRFGISKNRIYSFLNAFDRSKFNVNEVSQTNIQEKPNYLLFVGRLSEEKNLVSLI